MELDNVIFPTDEQVERLMDEDGSYRFEVENIDSRIVASQRTKNNEQLFIFRTKIASQHNERITRYKVGYYVLNESGQVVGRIPVTLNQTNDSVSMDYWIKPEFQGLGIGRVTLSEIVKDVFESAVFDGLPFKSDQVTMVDKIKLEINDDNYASKKIAEHNGFVLSDDGYHELTKGSYMAAKNHDDVSTK